MKRVFLLLFLSFGILFSKELTVSILPQKYFVEQIAKDKFNISVMVKPGASPATYEPKTSQMKSLTNSVAYFSIGVPFENVWLDKFKDANKKMLIVDTTEGIEKQPMQEHEHHEREESNTHKEHEHEKHEEEHNHEGLDPHVWLDPILVKIQAKNIYDALVHIDVQNEAFYTQNYNTFLKQLDALDAHIKTILQPYEERAFMVFHPSWGYFAHRYHLEQIAIEIQGKEPKPSQLIELIEEAKKHDIKIVFVSKQFSQKGAKTISSSIKANVQILDPLEYNWHDNVVYVANEIVASYK